MNKLFRMKTRLALADTAQYLSSAFKTPVREADVLELILDRHLTAQVHFVNPAYGRLCYEAHADVLGNWPPLDYYEAWCGLDGTFYCHLHVIDLTDDVFELVGMGNFRTELQSRFQAARGGPPVREKFYDYDSPDAGIFLRASDGKLYKLQTAHPSVLDLEWAGVNPLHASEHFFPATRLPQDCMLLLKRTEVEAFAQSDDCSVIDRPLLANERTSMLAMIGVLLSVRGIDPLERTAVGKFKAMCDLHGVAVSDDTVRRFFKRIPDAMNARTTR